MLFYLLLMHQYRANKHQPTTIIDDLGLSEPCHLLFAQNISGVYTAHFTIVFIMAAV